MMNIGINPGTDLTIVSGDNDVVCDANGNQYIDLFAGSGTVLLGHSNTAISNALAEQAQKAWSTGLILSDSRVRATELFESKLTEGYRLASFYSTGMEATEFAIRFARVTTDRPGFIGFENCMHGKSMAAAYFGWHNNNVELPHFNRLPFLPATSEEQILNSVKDKLKNRDVAALFLELLMGSGGGHMVSEYLAQEIAQLCKTYGTLLVCDEIFTGFYRAGPKFLHEKLGLKPDVVITGKALGNGFPVSAVIIKDGFSIAPAMLPGSTYAGNALACAVITATLNEMDAQNIAHRVGVIEQTIVSSLSALSDIGFALRGSGALWIIQTHEAAQAKQLAMSLLTHGVIASAVGSYIRLIPPATIDEENLKRACQSVLEACFDVVKKG